MVDKEVARGGEDDLGGEARGGGGQELELAKDVQNVAWSCVREGWVASGIDYLSECP